LYCYDGGELVLTSKLAMLYSW